MFIEDFHFATRCTGRARAGRAAGQRDDDFARPHDNLLAPSFDATPSLNAKRRWPLDERRAHESFGHTLLRD